jgi:hypothetical protein
MKPCLSSVVSGVRVACVHELVLGLAGVGGDALDAHHGLVGRERLVDDLADLPAVERVGDVGLEVLRHVGVHAAAYLLVRSEADADGAVRDVGVLEQVPRQHHDDGHASLVVGAEERRAAGRDDVLPHLLGEVGRGLGRQDLAGVVGQHDVAAVPGAVHQRLHACGVEGGRGVDVREEGDRRAGAVHGGGNRRQHGAVVGEDHVLSAHLLQAVHQDALQVELLGGARRRAGALVALGVDAGALDQPSLELPIERTAHVSASAWSWARDVPCRASSVTTLTRPPPPSGD